MLQHWIWLATRTGLGDRGRVALLEHFHDPEQIYFAREEDLAACGFLSPDAVGSLADKSLTQVQKILDDCTKKKLHVMTFHDGIYPRRLKNISDPPVVLYYKGNLPDLDGTPTIGVVGTREASAYGLTVAKRMGYQIAACGGIVVSGMAKGIDAMAMQGALTAGMSVVGVLGCGADIVYPARNRALFRDTEQYGCILSEFPPETPAYAFNFPRRNRIISGLSDGVLVVEAPNKSGALITARQAADQGRDVFAVPANIDVPTGEGSNALIRDGAISVSSGWDILSEYEGRYPGKIRQSKAGSQLKTYPDEVLKTHDAAEKSTQKVAQNPPKIPRRIGKNQSEQKKDIDNGGNEPYIDLTKIIPSLSEHERIIVDLLKNGQRLVDDVIADSELSAPLVLSSLTLLEVKGIVHRLPGRFIELAAEK